MNTGSLHTRSFRRIQSPFLNADELKKKWLCGGAAKSFRGFRETGPRGLKFLDINDIFSLLMSANSKPSGSSG